MARAVRGRQARQRCHFRPGMHNDLIAFVACRFRSLMSTPGEEAEEHERGPNTNHDSRKYLLPIREQRSQWSVPALTAWPGAARCCWSFPHLASIKSNRSSPAIFMKLWPTARAATVIDVVWPTSKVVGAPTYHVPSGRFENAEQSIVLGCAEAAATRPNNPIRMQRTFFSMGRLEMEGQNRHVGLGKRPGLTSYGVPVKLRGGGCSGETFTEVV